MNDSERVLKRDRAANSPGIEITHVSGQERDRLLVLDEDHFCDLKAMEIAPAKLTKTIAAFANASGGDVYVGDYLAVYD